MHCLDVFWPNAAAVLRDSLWQETTETLVRSPTSPSSFSVVGALVTLWVVANDGRNLGRGCRRVAKLAVIALVASAAVVVGGPLASADGPLVEQPITDRGVTLELTALVQLPNTDRGAARINNFALAGDRIFVVEDHSGKIYELDRNGRTATVSEFFDVGAAIPVATGRQLNVDNSFHGGLRSVAFHPEFESNGLFYTSVLEDRPTSPNSSEYVSDVDSPIAADSAVIEWTADIDTGQVDPASYRTVLRVGLPVFDHPIKQLSFNTLAEPGDEDYGLLYVAHGDGSVLSATAGGGQNNDALGKILRVNPRPSNGRSYTVPLNNPFVGDPSMLDEVYSLGHRNPHHLAFAEDAQGETMFFVAEVGRDNVEEVNIIIAGANYGWSEREGTFVHLDQGEGLVTGIAELPDDEAENGFTFPAIQFGHQGSVGAGFSGQAIAGGYVVDNGSALSGEYFFSDFPITGDIYHSRVADIAAAVTTLDPDVPARDHPSKLTQATISRVAVALDHDADAGTPAQARANPLDLFNDSANYDGSGRSDVRFGQGPNGELYVSSKKNGTVYLVANSLPPEATSPPTTPTQPTTPTGPDGPRLCQGLEATVVGTVGTPGNDVIVGTSRSDVITGGDGDDLICAFGGADRVDAGGGNDVVYAGWGADVIRTGSGDDLVFGGPGLDNVEGGAGHDILRGGDGGDRLVGNGGNDQLFGGDGRDRLFGFSGADELFGGAGTDNVRGGAGEDIAKGGGGIDVCVTSESLIGCELSSLEDLPE